MSTPLPGPPKHRAAPDAVVKVQPGGLTYETRIKWNASILLLQLLLWKIGVWAILVDLLKGIFGQTLGSIIDWLIILLPAVNVVEALWARWARVPPPIPHQQPQPAQAMTPVQKRLQSLSTSIPSSLLSPSMPKGLAYSPSGGTPSRRDLRFPDPRASLPLDSPANSGYSSPSPSVQARSRMKSSIKSPTQDLFASRSSSVEPSDLLDSTSSISNPSSRRRRKVEGGNSREASPFSISTLSLKNVPKPGRALDSSSLQRLVS